MTKPAIYLAAIRSSIRKLLLMCGISYAQTTIVVLAQYYLILLLIPITISGYGRIARMVTKANGPISISPH